MVSEALINPEFTTEFILFIISIFTLIFYMSMRLRSLMAMLTGVITLGVFFHSALLDESFIIVYVLMMFCFTMILFAQFKIISDN